MSHSCSTFRPPHTPHQPAWEPPAASHVELKDVDMAEASPPQVTMKDADEDESMEGNSRSIATGGMKRLFRLRQRQKEKSRLAVARVKAESDCSEAESDDDGGSSVVTPITQNTSNHYTLNMPGPASPRSETPDILIGYGFVVHVLTHILSDLVTGTFSSSSTFR